MEVEDYDTKVSKLLGHFNTDEQEIENASLNKTIYFVQEKRNENILVKMTNDEKYVVEFPKKILDLDLGEQILEYVEKRLDNERKEREREMIVEVEEDNTKKEEMKREESYQELKKNFKVKPMNQALKTKKFGVMKESLNKKSAIVLDLNNFQTIINDENVKMNKLKISYKEFLFITPKCDICDSTGITLEELKKINNNRQAQIDIIVLEYILYQCSICKVKIHKNCCQSKSFPFLNIKDKSSFTVDWLCDKCTDNKKTYTRINELCKICLKKEDEFKKPHLLKNIGPGSWAHLWCEIWFSQINNLYSK
jgi:hypothetical protein